MEKSYDYIIAGGGMAGLSLAFYLNENDILREKKVLIIDRDRKTLNDHTWCFWEKSAGAFEEIVFRMWKTVWFHGSKDFSSLFDLNGYRYKMIRAADFYEFILNRLSRNPNFEFLQAEIFGIEDAIVQTNAGEFTAREFVFDSFTRLKYDNPRDRNLFQHFRGWLIETEKDAFDSSAPTLFDFRVEQKNECRFLYILPFSARRALVEFTVFSDNLLETDEYEFYLTEYIAKILRAGNFTVVETEAGVIPMTDAAHDESPAEKIVRIGTAGGYVKPSTGYSFQRAQRRLQHLANQLSKAQNPNHAVSKVKTVWKKYLDSILLDVLLTNKYPAADVFTEFFRNNPTALVLKFLDEDTDFFEDLRVMRSVPLLPFGKAAAEVLVKNILR